MGSSRQTSTPSDSTARFGGAFTATLFRYEGPGGWFFAPVPEEFAPPVTHGWGRTPVVATVDGLTWQTSVWRGKDGRTLLAVPKKARRGKGSGDTVRVTIAFTSL